MKNSISKIEEMIKDNLSAGMTYDELESMVEVLSRAKDETYARFLAKKNEEKRSITREYIAKMASFDLTQEEVMSLINMEISTLPDMDEWCAQVVGPEECYDVVIPDPTIPEYPNLEAAKSVVSLVSESQENKTVETKTTSVFDLPALKEPYNPLKTRKSVPTPKPEKTSVEETEEDIPSMESLLSDDPEYKAFYHPVTPRKKNNRTLPTMDELLSDEPVNKILCLGNEQPKGKAYRQHTRINHVAGIIPTETATGKTGIYIPAS